MGEWHTERLGELIEKVVDNRGKTPPLSEVGYEVIEVNAISSTKKFPDYSKIRKYVSEETYQSWFRAGHPFAGDILIPTVGTIGNASYMQEERGSIAQNLIALRVNDRMDSSFLYYFLSSPLGRELTLNLDIGGVQPSVKVPHFLDLEIPYPPVNEQKAIAEVLSSLDDKIDLLHRQNQTLESLAETLFRHTFIDNAQDDWKTVRLGDVVETNTSTIKKDYEHSVIQYLDTGSITRDVVDGYQEVELSEAPSRAKRLVKHNDIIISTVRPNQEHYGIIKNPLDNLVVSTGFCVITCKKIDPHFAYIFLTTDEMTEHLHVLAEASTSTYPSLKPFDIEELEFKMPPEALMNDFAQLADGHWQKIEANHREIKTLESLRDTLLPKLMSGDVRVQYDETSQTEAA